MHTSQERSTKAPVSYPAGTIWSLRRIGQDPMAFLEMTGAEGDIVEFSIGRQRGFLLKHPDYIEDVLVSHHRQFVKAHAFGRARRLLGNGLLTADGQLHVRRRQLVQPAFHRAQISSYGNTMVACAARLGHRWRDGDIVDVGRDMQALTLAIVSKTLFGMDVESQAAEVREAVAMATASVDPLLSLVAPLRRVRHARRRLQAIVDALIERRRGMRDDGEDLLSLLLRAEVATDGVSEQLRDDALTLFLAGHDTIANALTWTWMLLAQHRDAEEGLHREVATVLGGRLPTADDFPRLVYTKSVLAECLRLFPPAWVIARLAVRQHRIDTTVIPSGSLIIVSQYLTHRDPRFFPEPLTFNPDRWLSPDQRSRPRLAYFPFGAGPRSCIGEGFAWMEGVLLLATLAQRWRMQPTTATSITIDPRITLRPREPVLMQLTRARDAALQETV